MNPQTINFIVTIGIFIVFMYLMIIRPQKKREKKTRDMLASLKEGNDIITIGGIIGKIVNIKDDEITIESGIEKSKVLVKKWAIKEVIVPVEE